MHTIHNERIKLLATAFNNLALAVVVAGFIAPVTTGHLHEGGQAMTAVAWMCFGTGLHISAQTILGNLKQ